MSRTSRLQEAILSAITGEKGYYLIRTQTEKDAVKSLCVKYYNVDIARIGEDEYAFLIERGEELADKIADERRGRLTTKERQDIRRLRRKARRYAQVEVPMEEGMAEESITPQSTTPE